MIKDNRIYNETVKSNSDFLNELKTKLPEFFVDEKYDDDGNRLSRSYFDIEKFKQSLSENNINELNEGYQLSFIGKDYAKKQAGEKATAVVVPDIKHNNEEINKNSKNLFFTGDNLEVLRHLQNNYRNSIDVIYIDPPYNTGNDGFVYPDKFEYSDEILKNMFGLNDEELGKLKSIQGKATHSAWLTFMYPRLAISKRLLSDEGFILISIDEHEIGNLNLLGNEIFGENNFVENFIWIKNSTKNLSATTSTNHEYVVCYSKNKEIIESLNMFRKDKPGLKQVDAILRTANEKKWTVEKTERELKSFYRKSPELKGISMYNRVELRYDALLAQKCLKAYTIDNISAPKATGVAATYDVIHPKTGLPCKSPTRGWAFTRETMQEHIDNDLIHFYEDETKVPRFKRFLDTVRTEVMKSTIEDFTDGKKELMRLFDGEALFSNAKPTTLIKSLIAMKEKGVILDFFAGSGTTADAVLQLNAEDGGNRQFIMVQIDEPTYEIEKEKKVARKGSETAFNAGYMSVDEISRERIKRASQKIQEERGLTLPENFDGGFKHYRVVKPTQATLNDLESYDPNSGMFFDSKGQMVYMGETDFDNMIDPFSSEGLKVEGEASGVDTILTTWMIQDGYKMDSSINKYTMEGYDIYYVDEARLYLIGSNWESNHTRELLNKIGNYELNVQTIIVYGYSFGLESMRELELGLKQLPTKVNLMKRY